MKVEPIVLLDFKYLLFLIQVDRLIGKDHLFKRSIILIKAWCYYESRILGAHHGLISTYALETLVLYIFHLFHSTLNGPLSVLYKFLDYFSKFDWDNYCISLTGPVRISSLPEIVVETPENGGSDLLLSNDFIRYYVDMFSVPSRGIDINSRTFPQKHFNIVDPLKENNNLGRSISKGNFYRIRSAFTYGARKLGQILSQRDDDIANELQDLATSRIQGLKISNELPKFSPGEEHISPLGIAHHAPHLYFSGKSLGNGKMRYGNSDKKELEYSASTGNKVSSGQLQAPDEGTSIIVGPSQDRNQLVGNHNILNSVGPKDVLSVPTTVACSSEDLHPGGQERTSAGIAGSPEYLTCLSDLSGDYDSHLSSLQYGWWCYDIHRSSSGMGFPIRMLVVLSQDCVFYPMNAPVIPGVTIGVEEMPKPRGTGTYFPNTNRPPYQKPSSLRGRNQAPVRSPRNNGRTVTPMEANLAVKSSHELSQAQLPLDQGGERCGSSDTHQSGSPGGRLQPIVNGLILQSNGLADFGSVGQLPMGAPLLESSRQPNHASSFNQSSSQSLLTPGVQRPKPLLGMNQERVSVESSYHLKDEDDFPPLSF
ncbi:hypothetical protein F0562_017843 [Nyssa sinensis]|uniref:PAP/OAS1 substrate-binding-related domain-containing protein n=1 Tax=Nyssa sinensis TaxID=561372 RepID=A0A5J4ZJT9_9ASTE|nr:hypothetical protein F0562_017843 [Nyssa sinensis]